MAMLAVTANAQTNCIVTLRSDRTFDMQFSSNAPCAYTNAEFNPTNWCDRIPASEQERAVRDLAVGGVICNFIGHWWGTINPWGAWYEFEATDSTKRKCHICGKVETKTEEWK
jgi:hypothetical protein